MKKLNHKAFTLIELIVVITILGIILILALPQVSRIQRQNKNRKYELYQESLENAAKLYIDSNAKDLFENSDSGCVQIKYSQLKNANLIKDFSESDAICSNDTETFVEVRKIKERYTYHSQLICREKDNLSNILYEYSDNIEGASCLNVRDETGPEITINPGSSAWKRKETLKVTITISDVSGLNKNIAISYYWTNLDTGEKSKTYRYNYKNKNNVEKVSYTIPTENIDIESGRYRLTVESDPNSPTGIMDMMRNRRVTAKTAESYYIDNTPPTCITTGGGDTWSEEDITLVGTCKDNESGCMENVSKKFTDLYRDSLETPGTVKDKVGNKTECPEQRVRISKKPKTPTINNPTNGNWVNYGYAVTGSTTSSNDLVAYWQTSTDNKNWTTIKGATTNTFTSKTYTKEQDKTRYFRVCNKDDVCSQSSSTKIRIDKTNPKISVSYIREDNGAPYISGSLADVTIVRNISYNDEMSDVKDIYYSFDAIVWGKENNLTNHKYPEDHVNETIYFKAIDNAGNTTQIGPYVVKIEKNVDKNFNISCRKTCYTGCGTLKPDGSWYWNDSKYEWFINGANSGINMNTMLIDYSTEWVASYCIYKPSTAPWGEIKNPYMWDCGYATFSPTNMTYSRSYARSQIVGSACTNKNICNSCVIRE